MAPREAQSATQFHAGPFVQENWLHFDAGDPLTSTIEVPLYSDARIVGQRDFGPYVLVNTVPRIERFGRLRPALVLRYAVHVPARSPDFKHKGDNDERYHGGLLADEIAALLSLCLGIRLWAGQPTRRFDSNGDPFGRPSNDERPPILTSFAAVPIIASVMEPASLSRADLLSTVPRLSAKAGNAVIRAARSYQRAIWLAESDPNQTWLLLVSAVEAAANQWSSEGVDRVQVLREHKPKLCEALMSCGGEQAIFEVAQEFADQMKSTAKFVQFMKEHCPGPPPRRPHPVAQHAWTPVELESAFRRIYRYRSVGLHTGRPFPAPMCELPFRHQEWDAPEEIMTAEKMGAYGGEWTKKSVPMLLHVFERIVRESLHKWWAALEKGSA